MKKKLEENIAQLNFRAKIWEIHFPNLNKIALNSECNAKNNLNTINNKEKKKFLKYVNALIHKGKIINKKSKNYNRKLNQLIFNLLKRQQPNKMK